MPGSTDNSGLFPVAKVRWRQAGVSLTEVMVVVLLVGSMTLVSLPSLANLLRTNEIRSAGSALALAFRQAQGMAISQQKNFIVAVAPVQQVTAPRFCWAPPIANTLYAIVEDVEGDCKIGRTSLTVSDCAANDVRLVDWGPSRPNTVDFVAQPVSAEPIDIGGGLGGDRFKTLCFTPRGYVSRETPVGSGVHVGIARKSLHRRVQVSAAGRVRMQRYQTGQWLD